MRATMAGMGAPAIDPSGSGEPKQAGAQVASLTLSEAGRRLGMSRALVRLNLVRSGRCGSVPVTVFRFGRSSRTAIA